MIFIHDLTYIYAQHYEAREDINLKHVQWLFYGAAKI